MSKKTLIFIFIILAVAGLIIYLFLNNKEDKKNISAENNNVLQGENKISTEENKINEEEKKDWLEYKNSLRNFSLKYPPDLLVKEYDEGDGTYTIVFKDAKDEKSFQIFFTPYMGEVITQSRILRDVPSGDFTTPIEVVIGGNTRALVFLSKGTLGELREVWFLHEGFLYEVTTFSNLDSWLSQVLDTWRFIN